jgi:tetratricopeptide (TPR) repeat protein
VAADPRSIAEVRTLALVEEYEGRRLEGLGRSDEALVKSRQSISATEMALARSPSDLGLVSQALASEESIAAILAHRGDHRGAIEMARKAIARAEGMSAPASERYRATRAVAAAYQNLASIEVTFGNWGEAQVAAQRAVNGWQQVIASGSRRADPAQVALAEALLKDCNAHLR